MQVTVVHLDGSKRGQTETFDAAMIPVGRDPSNMLVFDPHKDVDVSARHAQFIVQGNQLMLQDLNSRNGTFVNGQKLGAGPVPLGDGSLVQFGDKGPKVQVTCRVVPTGPGKKTQMIGELEANLAKQKQSAAKGKAIYAFILAFVVVGGGGGFFLFSTWKAKKDLATHVEALAASIPDKKKNADAAGAAELAKAEWEKALKSEKDGADLHAQGKDAEAEAAYKASISSFEAAQQGAMTARMNQLAAANKALSEKKEEAEKQQKEKEVVREKEIVVVQQEADKKALEEVARLKKELEAAKTVQELGPLVDEGLKATKIEKVQSVLEQIDAKLKAGPNDQLSTWKKSLEDRITALKAIPPKLEKVAKDAKLSMVWIQATSYALPRSQTERTSQIREFIATASGTGFFVAKDKIATAKELVEPWKFDPVGVALSKKWAELAYKVSTRVDVYMPDDKGTWVLAASTNAEQEQPTATVIHVGADSIVDKAVDFTVKFQEQEFKVPVQLHRRDSSDVAVLQLRDKWSVPLALTVDDATKAQDPVVAVGQKVEKKGETLDAKLYYQQTNVSQIGPIRALSVGGLNTWVGGPVLDPDGKVVGLIIEAAKDGMRVLAPSRVKEAAALN